MWQQLQCNYYVELIAGIICDTASTLDEDTFSPEEFIARKSNLKNSICTLQMLLLTYKESNQIPADYVLLYGPLIDLKSLISCFDSDMTKEEKAYLFKKLLEYKEQIRSIHEKVSGNKICS